MRYRIDRANGRLDRWCMTATNIFKDAACNQYVVGGDRYIHYPKSDNTDYCCYCCSADHGCGVLKNTWTTTALFIGNDTMNGVPAFKWNIKGGQDNFYWETMVEDPTKRVMLDLFQTPDDDMQFNKDSFTTTFDRSLLDLPSSCNKNTTCPVDSICTALRLGGSMKKFL